MLVVSEHKGCCEVEIRSMSLQAFAVGLTHGGVPAEGPGGHRYEGLIGQAGLFVKANIILY